MIFLSTFDWILPTSPNDKIESESCHIFRDGSQSCWHFYLVPTLCVGMPGRVLCAQCLYGTSKQYWVMVGLKSDLRPCLRLKKCQLSYTFKMNHPLQNWLISTQLSQSRLSCQWQKTGFLLVLSVFPRKHDIVKLFTGLPLFVFYSSPKTHHFVPPRRFA